jgi:integrin beta 3
MFDGKAFGKEVVAVVRAHMEKAVAPLEERIAYLERQLAERPMPKDGVDGKSITADDVAPLIADEVARAVAALPPAEKGKDADPEQVASLVKEEAERILAGWERPKDGKDGAPGEKGADGAPGRDGIDGKDGLNGKDGAPGLNGKDGIDTMDVMIDREGQLVFTMSDGRLKSVGLVVGRDGEPGRDGRDGAAGPNGKDGTDGVGFDDMSCEIREDGVYLVWEKGDLVKEARLPVPLYRGVFKEGSAYLAGDSVSFGGSTFIAERETSAKPETPDSGWRLSVKRGRDGKDAPSTKPDPKKGK